MNKKIGFLCSDKKWRDFGHSLAEEISVASNSQAFLEHISSSSSSVSSSALVLSLRSGYSFILQKDPKLLQKDIPLFNSEYVVCSPVIYKYINFRSVLFDWISPLYCPKYLGHFRISDYCTIDEMRDAIQSNLRFPIIIKNDISFGDPVSHNMCIVSDPLDITYQIFTTISSRHEDQSENSNCINTTCVNSGKNDPELVFFVQEFIPHYRTVFKVFVVADQCWVVPRASVGFENGWSIISSNVDRQPFYFYSQDLSKDALDPHHVEYMPSLAKINQLRIDLFKELPCEYFGFDLLVDERDSSLKVVDVNYLPSFKGSPGAFRALARHLVSRLEIN